WYGNGWRPVEGPLSAMHLAAYCGQREYVLQGAHGSPGLLDGIKDLHLLLSAALGGNTQVVQDLIEQGTSFDMEVPVPYRILAPPPHWTSGAICMAPFWMVVLAYMAGLLLNGRFVGNGRGIFKVLLQHAQLSAKDC